MEAVLARHHHRPRGSDILDLIIVLSPNCDIKQRVVQQCFHLLHLIINGKLTNRLAFISIPTGHFLLHMVKQWHRPRCELSRLGPLDVPCYRQTALHREFGTPQRRSARIRDCSHSYNGVQGITHSPLSRVALRGHRREKSCRTARQSAALASQDAMGTWVPRTIGDRRSLMVVVCVVVGVVRFVIVLLRWNHILIVLVMRCTS